MNWRWRNLVFVLLAVLSVIAIDRITAHSEKDEEHLQTDDQSSSKQPSSKTSEPLQKTSPENARLVPLYDEGDLHISKVPKAIKAPPKKPNKKKPKNTKKKQKIISSQSKPKTNATNSSKTTGNRPVLEVAYDRIGFARYLDVIERVGRLFILVETKKGTRLGPEISLKLRTLYSGVPDMSILAAKRPHLISDKRIHNRLSTIKIPDDAHNDRVVLILTKPFDNLLWDTIKDALKKRQLRLSQISQIVGDYEEGVNGVFLLLDSVVVKGSGKMVILNRKLRVSL